MTPEEKKQKRAEYARAYYAKNKDKMKAAKKTGSKAVKKTGSKEAINPKLGVERNVEKLAERTAAKGAKIISTAETLVKAMGDVLSEAYRAKSQELVDKVIKMFTKKLNMEITEDDGTKLYLSVDLGTRTVRIPKAMQKEPDKAPETAPETAADKEPTMEELKEIDADVEAAMPEDKPEEILADVTVINALREGTVTEADVERANEEEYGDRDDEIDEDELDDDELDDDERAERDAERDWEGRSEMMREFDAQGVYDD